MRLSEIMQTDVQTISAGQSAEEAWERMRLHRFHHLVVMDGSDVVGVISDRDLRGAKAARRRDLPVGEVMSADVISASPDTTVRQAANLMRGRTVGCLPVVDAGALVGIVTITDLLELIGRGGIAKQHQPDPTRRMARTPRVPRH